MALKGDRTVAHDVDISFFMTATGERGGVVVVSAAGSGTSLDDATAVVAYPTVGTVVSGQRPIGVLLNDVVSLDLTRQHLNEQKNETQAGGKVEVLRRGTVTSNRVSGTPTKGQPAYFNERGAFTPTAPTIHGTGQLNLDGDANQLADYRVGQFLSVKDADGYAKVSVNVM